MLVNIAGVPKKKVFAQLYNSAKKKGFGALNPFHYTITDLEASVILEENALIVDRVYGKPIYIDFNSDMIDDTKYDKSHGKASVFTEVSILRKELGIPVPVDVINVINTSGNCETVTTGGVTPTTIVEDENGTLSFKMKSSAYSFTPIPPVGCVRKIGDSGPYIRRHISLPLIPCGANPTSTAINNGLLPISGGLDSIYYGGLNDLNVVYLDDGNGKLVPQQVVEGLIPATGGLYIDPTDPTQIYCEDQCGNLVPKGIEWTQNPITPTLNGDPL